MRSEPAPGIVYCDRAESNLPPPHNNDGVTPRPLLQPLRETITAHYPGSPVGTSFADMRGDVKKKTYIAGVQRNAMSNPDPKKRKSFEYNFFIFMDGEIWEYAGDYLAAHSEGENAIAYGVQFVNGQDDLCTDAQVRSYRWLRDVHLKQRNRVTSDAVTTPHREMPGANTQCPGDRAIMPRLDDLRQPYQELPQPPPTPTEDEMKPVFIQDSTGVYITGDWVTRRAVAPADVTLLSFTKQVQTKEDGTYLVIPLTVDDMGRMRNVSPGQPALTSQDVSAVAAAVVAALPAPGVVDVAALAAAIANELSRRLTA